MESSKHALRRDVELARLADETFDLVVVGAGVHGASMARAATLQGWRVALVDAEDFGSGASANSLKLVHGGLRYLQRLDVARVRSSSSARRRLLALAPHLVRPLRCIVPTYGYGARGRWIHAAAFRIGDLLAPDRSRGLEPGQRLPRSRTISRARCLQAIPGVEARGLTGGALWYDAVADTDRLTLELALDAARRGAAVANYVRVLECRAPAGRVTGVVARDEETGSEVWIRAAVVVNATGAWRPPPIVAGGSRTGIDHPDHVLAWNLVVARELFEDQAVGLPARDPRPAAGKRADGRRHLFFVPWRGSTLIGTLYRAADTGAGSGPSGAPPRPVRDDVERFLALVNEAYPAARIARDEVSYVQWGLLPAAPGGGAKPLVPADRARIADGRMAGVEGLLTVTGVKFTTAIEVADQALRAAALFLGRDHRRVPDGWLEPVAEAGEAADLAVRAVRREMARTLADVVLRRTDIAALGHPGADALSRWAGLLAGELGWPPERIGREIAAVEDRFAQGLVSS